MPLQDTPPASPDALDFSVTPRPFAEGLACVDVVGELDTLTSPTLKNVLYELIAEQKYHIVLDFTRLRYIDSSGMGVLIGALKRVSEHGGRIILICPSARIQKLFNITGLSRVFEMHPTEVDLLDALASK